MVFICLLPLQNGIEEIHSNPKKFWGTNGGTNPLQTSKKAFNQRLFYVLYDTPYRARTCDP